MYDKCILASMTNLPGLNVLGHNPILRKVLPQPYGHFSGFSRVFGHKMAKMGRVGLKIGSLFNLDLNNGNNKHEVHMC